MYNDVPRPDRQLFGISLQWILFIVALVVILATIGWTLGWITVPGQVVSPQNVQEQFQFAYKYYNAMVAGALQTCLFEKDLETLSGDAKIQRQSQLLAIETTYTQNAAAYNAAMENTFKAKYVKPGDLPDRAPSLDQMRSQVCR